MKQDAKDTSEGVGNAPGNGVGDQPKQGESAGRLVETGRPAHAKGHRVSPSAPYSALDKQTVAKVEEWRIRQASRAVPAAYRTGAGRVPDTVLTPDAGVLDEQNAIPEQGRPVRTRPSIPNYTSRLASEDPAVVVVGSAEEQGGYLLDADAVDLTDNGWRFDEPFRPSGMPRIADGLASEGGLRSAIQSVSEGFIDSAAKAGEAGSALFDNIQHSEMAAQTKDFVGSIPGRTSEVASQVSARMRDENGRIRKKPLAIGVAVVVYLAVALFFSFHYYPAASIGPVGVGGMDVAQASEALAKAVDGYALQVEGDDGVSFTVMGSDAGLSLDAADLAQKAMDADTGLLWPIEIFLPHDHSDVVVASADSQGLRRKVTDAVAWYNQDAKAPQDATIAYDEKEHAFAIVAEERGDTLDVDKVTSDIVEALASMQPLLTLDEDDYLQPAIFQDDARLLAALEEAQQMLGTDATFTAHGSNVATLDGDTVAKWVMTDENAQVLLDEEQVNAWVQALVDKVATVGSERSWMREDGVKCTVKGGDYGWEADWLAVDEALHEAIGSGDSEKVEIPMRQEADVYNGAGERDWESYIDVDLDAQHATYYDKAGKVLWEADFVSGADDGEHDTPQGVYSINNKESPSILLGDSTATGSPEYQTKVEYWMPWEGNSVGFHDAEWQDEFGGTRYQDGFGSHGCINLSVKDAAKLYKLAPVGTVVVCHSRSGAADTEPDDTEPDEE